MKNGPKLNNGEMMSIIKQIPCSENEYLILVLMEKLRDEQLIGKLNLFGGNDEVLFHSGGPITKKSTKSILIGPSNFRFKAKQPSKKILLPNSQDVNPIEGKIILGPKPPNLIWNVEKWNNNGWDFFNSVEGESLSRSLVNLEEFLPNFITSPGTCCGVFAYELCQWTQPWQLINPPNEDTIIGILYSIDRWVIHDREKEIIEIGSNEDEEWVKKVFKVINSIENLEQIHPKWPKENSTIQTKDVSNLSDKEHIDKIKKVKSAIRSGELYQLNFGRKWKGELREEPWDLQLRLAKENPAPWSCFIFSPDLNFCICSSSPEILIKGENGVFSTSPIKGTKARGVNEEKDQELIKELINCPKERAEHLMLVDLEKNDMTKFSKYGSIFRKSFQVESFSQVHHLVSDIYGEIRDGLDIWSVLEAIFPGGSITGCPKTVTIASIDQLEKEPRSFWTGSAGIFHHKNRSISMNILIRTLEAHKNKSKWEGIIQAGGGLVIGSNPKNEVEEAKLKAAALRKVAGWIKNESIEHFPSKNLTNLTLQKKTYSKKSQRVGKVSIWPKKFDKFGKNVAFIDNLDSFSWNIINELAMKGANVCVIPGRQNSPTFIEIMENLTPTHFVIGPGPGEPRVSKLSIEIASNAIIGKCPPLLGICLGHQAIGVAAGWELIKTPDGAVHGEVHQIENLGSSIINIEQNMTRYHSLTLIERKNENNKLKVVLKLKGKKDSVMGIEHEMFPIFGVQFHPESEESEGNGELFENFLKY
tara:strand:+ start:125 stop:2398 length:2274 start_codon:yes stop_codon:yes gene_type:complete